MPQAEYEDGFRDASHFLKVAEFHRAGNQAVNCTPAFPDHSTRDLRFRLINEELAELSDADFNDDIVGVADALTDLLYVVYGMGHAYGIDLDACFAEVHRSNMTKFPLVKREDGKVLKGPNYEPPELEKILFSEGTTL